RPGASPTTDSTSCAPGDVRRVQGRSRSATTHGGRFGGAMRANRLDLEDLDAGNVALPHDVQDAILSWGRIIAKCGRDHKKAKFEEAVGELLPFAKTKGDPVHQAVVDRLQQIARAHNIGDDEAQAIMAGARSCRAN